MRDDKMPEGFKMTEVGLLPENWEVNELGEAIKLIMGQSPPGRTYNEYGNGMPFLQGKAEFGSIYPSHVKYTTRPLKIASEGSVLISIRAPVGDVNIADIEYCIGRGLASLSLKAGCNVFLFYLMMFLKHDIEGQGTGSTFKAINKSRLEKFRIPLPPLPEQRKIAEILSTVDDAIQKADEAIAKTERLKKGLMQELLTKGIGHKEFKDTEIGRIPKEWELIKLGKIADVRYGIGQPPTLDDNGIPVIRATNIKEGKISKTDMIHVSADAIPSSRNPFLKEGDVIVVRSGVYTGDIALVIKEWAGAIAGYDLVVTPSSRVNSLFLAEFMLSSFVQKEHFAKLKARSAQPHLNSSQVEETPISLPPLPEQLKIAEILSTVDTKLEFERKRKEKLERIKKGLMNDLLTGRRRVKL